MRAKSIKHYGLLPRLIMFVCFSFYVFLGLLKCSAFEYSLH